LATRKIIRPWYFGNTTVRSPFRLREGLILLSTSSLQGDLHGARQEIEFRNLLGQAGIVNLGEDESYSISRKWRAALSQNGFLYPKVTKKSDIKQSDIGKVDTITKNGWNLINSETVAGMQECFLRSLSAYYIPNILESRPYNFDTVFSPLRHILKIMLALEQQTGSSKLEFLEIALMVLWTNSESSIEGIASNIIQFRQEKKAASRKRQFNQDCIRKASIRYLYAETSFSDYADVTIRYLKATGLVQAKGHGVILAPEKYQFVTQYAFDSYLPANGTDYLINLCNGAKLPTDNEATARLALTDLVGKLNKRGEKYDLDHKNTADVSNITILRHEVEDKIAILNEIDYAKNQAEQWEEISSYMDLLLKRRRGQDSDNEIFIPRGEDPAYFEWVIWRAFLAINNIKNPPNESRKFKIDQDFFPINTAPGRAPDLIFEFENFVVVVEVTLTENSRQEAAEGESVRRHVADCVQFYKSKKVFGLFLARQIDINAAETFRSANWYFTDGQKINLDIVPIPLSDFQELFLSMFINNSVDCNHVQEILQRCRKLNNQESPVWRQLIVDEVKNYSKQLSEGCNT
jgi:hypothetical protein